ncbi:MAG: hypothetical protein EXS48_03725 [Candidatus Staskawiczbacteria bacterium]|nr:hypothetical protein [Candidatus Staskawiczbacteria bacterium]
MTQPFLDVELKCRACGKLSKIGDLIHAECLPTLDGYFCQCDTDKDRPLAGHNSVGETKKLYLEFAEIVKQLP